jgi:myo-inositol-1(or 4)-monophosphatase
MASPLETAVAAAREAGQVLLEGYGTDLAVESKGDSSLVTRVDRESEDLVVSHIRRVFPEHRILAEEGSQGAAASEYCWVIDPLDGTHNYIRQAGEFGVSIGLVQGDEFVVGVIYLPTSDDLYAAERGSGAFHNGERMRVSSLAELSE